MASSVSSSAVARRVPRVQKRRHFECGCRGYEAVIVVGATCPKRVVTVTSMEDTSRRTPRMRLASCARKWIVRCRKRGLRDTR